MSSPRFSEDQRPGNETLYVGTDKKETRQNIWPAGSEFDGGNSLSCQQHRESESMERKKYALSQDEGSSPDMHIPSPHPVDKSKKVAKQAPIKKEVYHSRGISCQGAMRVSGAGTPRC